MIGDKEVLESQSNISDQRNRALESILQSQCLNLLGNGAIKRNLGDVEIQVDAANLFVLMTALRDSPELAFNLFSSVTAIDWMDAREERFEVVYHLRSLKHGFLLRIKVAVSETNPEVESVVNLWPGASFMEREVWDMYGIVFKGHPNLTRILMYEEFKGHPLRKDYPVQGKQPRIPMRTPEVENTAVFMERPALVQIKNRKKELSANQ